jgi:molybdate transport system substrate-binding protein
MCEAHTAASRTAGARVTPVSQEDNVKAVVNKVSLGEADADIVYQTDVKAGGSKVQGVDIPDQYNVVAAYPIVQLKTSQNGAAAKAFIAEVTGSQGQAVLEQCGFILSS